MAALNSVLPSAFISRVPLYKERTFCPSSLRLFLLLCSGSGYVIDLGT